MTSVQTPVLKKCGMMHFANENKINLPCTGSKRAVRVSTVLNDSVIMSAIGHRQQVTKTENSDNNE